MKKKLSEEKLNQIKTLYAAGYDFYEVSKMTGVGHTVLQRYYKELGLGRRRLFKVLDNTHILCLRCNETKSPDDFPKTRNKLSGPCKACTAKNRKQYAEGHKEEIATYKKQWAEENKEELKEYKHQYYLENVQETKQRTAEYKKDHREEINTRKSNRRKEDPVYKLRHNISIAITRLLKKNNSSKYGQSIMKYLPYTIEELKLHIENQFNLPENLTSDGKIWMTWENHGIYNPKTWDNNDSSTWTWHLDHIIPQSKLPHTSMEDENFQKCWALSNLRPFKSLDNIKKGNKLLTEEIK